MLKMGIFSLLSLATLVLFATQLDSGYCLYGTIRPVAEHPKFVTLRNSTSISTYLGAIVSKRFMVVPVEVTYNNATTWYVYYKNVEYRVVQSFTTQSSFGMVKICKGLKDPYSVTSFKSTSFPDHSQNLYGHIYFYSAKDKLFKTRSIDVLADASCAADSVGNDAEGNITIDTNQGCMQFEIFYSTCQHFFEGTDTVNYYERAYPWLIVNDQPVGILLSTYCSAGKAATGTPLFKKLSGARDSLLPLGVFDEK